MVGVDQIQYRSYVGRGGRGRGDQDGAGDTAWGDAEDVARGCAHTAGGLDCGGGVVIDRVAAVAGAGRVTEGGGVVVRD